MTSRVLKWPQGDRCLCPEHVHCEGPHSDSGLSLGLRLHSALCFLNRCPGGKMDLWVWGSGSPGGSGVKNLPVRRET